MIPGLPFSLVSLEILKALSLPGQSKWVVVGLRNERDGDAG